MGGERITVRVLGIASTTRGLAFAVTEGPRRLVDTGLRRIPARRTAALKAIDLVLQKARPLFVAFERETSQKKRNRGRMFSKAVADACETGGIMLLSIGRAETNALSEIANPTKWDVAEALVKHFPEIAGRLPRRRRAWQSEDERIGIFLALAAAVAAWENFRRPH